MIHCNRWDHLVRSFKPYFWNELKGKLCSNFLLQKDKLFSSKYCSFVLLVKYETASFVSLINFYCIWWCTELSELSTNQKLALCGCIRFSACISGLELTAVKFKRQPDHLLVIFKKSLSRWGVFCIMVMLEYLYPFHTYNEAKRLKTLLVKWLSTDSLS